MAVVLYSPSLAIQQVTGIPMWISIFLTGLICTIYTSLVSSFSIILFRFVKQYNLKNDEKSGRHESGCFYGYFPSVCHVFR